MSDTVEQLTLEHLKRLQPGQDRIESKLAELIGRVGSLEGGVASLHVDFASLSLCVDRTNDRIEHIERRPDLTDGGHP